LSGFEWNTVEVIQKVKHWLSPPHARRQELTLKVRNVTACLSYSDQNLIVTVVNRNDFMAEEGVIASGEEKERLSDLVE